LTRLADGQVWHYVTDHLGTPQEMYDQDGEIVWAADFSAYGLTARSLAREVDNPIRFPGQYHDAESGLHYNRHRYYDPNVGRYITKDPIGLWGWLNEYAYVNGNPIQAVDPLGLRTGPVRLGLGNVYRADVMPPQPGMAQNSAAASLMGEIANYPFKNDRLPGEWVGVNVPWSMPELGTYCADGYYSGDFLLSDNSWNTCKPARQSTKLSFVSEGKSSKKFVCTKWVIYEIKH